MPPAKICYQTGHIMAAFVSLQSPVDILNPKNLNAIDDFVGKISIYLLLFYNPMNWLL